MTELHVRCAKREDAAQIHAFIVELAVYEKAAHEVLASVADIEKSLFSEDSTAYALIGEKQGVAIGMAVYFFSYSTWLGKSGIYLEDLYVSEQHRGCGMGRKLLSHLAGIAIEKQCKRLEWSVLDWNEPAIKVYNALGAKPREEWIGYRLTGDALLKLAEAQ